MNIQEIRERLNELLELGGEEQFEEIKEILLSSEKTTAREKDFAIARAMLAVCVQEQEERSAILFGKVKSLEELMNRYTKLMFYIRRFDFDNVDENVNELNQFIAENRVSPQELFIVLYCGIVHKETVLEIIKNKIVTGELKL